MAFRIAFFTGAESFTSALSAALPSRLSKSGRFRSTSAPAMPSSSRHNLGLGLLSFLDLLLPLLALLLRGRELLERSFDLDCVYALRRHLEGEPQRTLDRDLAEAEIFVVEDLGATVLGHVSVQLHDLDDVAIRQLLTLVPQALPHLHEEIYGVDELDFAAALLSLAIGQNPDIGRDAGVVEHAPSARR